MHTLVSLEKQKLLFQSGNTLTTSVTSIHFQFEQSIIRKCEKYYFSSLTNLYI